jgi:hypothetical protein
MLAVKSSKIARMSFIMSVCLSVTPSAWSSSKYSERKLAKFGTVFGTKLFRRIIIFDEIGEQ